MKKILFIAKQRELTSKDPDNWDSIYSHSKSTGLYNSISFLIKMFEHDHKCEAKFVQVVDNNFIDREVKEFKPDIVIIEALWVVPEKFEILAKLHPRVEWIIRLHSETPFIAFEGIAMDWIGKYIKHKNVKLASNSPRMKHELKSLFKCPVLYLPNYYSEDITPE